MSHRVYKICFILLCTFMLGISLHVPARAQTGYDQQTLEMFEVHGGEDAFINIKYMIPTYESCMF